MSDNEEQFDSRNAPNGGGNKIVWVVVAVMTVICVAVGVLSSVLTGYFMRRGTPLPSIVVGEHEENIAAVVKARKPAITEIVCGGLRGSGVSMRYEKGKVYVMTNAHVIGINKSGDSASDSIVVRFYNEDDGFPANVVGYSVLYDVAVLSVEHSEVYIIDTPEVFIRDLDYSEGDYTVAIGNAMGYGISAYDGIISRSSDVITSTEKFYDDYGEETTVSKSAPVLRTTSAINAGMSGGALFDMEGHFLGLGTYRLSTTSTSDSNNHNPSNDVEDTGFATPVSIVYDIYRQIIEYGTGGEIGGIPMISYYGATTSTAIGGMNVTYIGAGTFTAEYRRGKLTVSGVDTASPVAGLQIGDVIVKIGGTELYPAGKEPYDLCRTAGELLRYRYLASEGDKLTLGLLRGDKSVTVEIEGYFGYVR